MANENVRDVLRLAQDRYLLCKFRKAFPNNEFVQVVLDVISDQAEIVTSISYGYEHENVFDSSSIDAICYVKAENFESFLDGFSVSLDLNEQVEELNKLLKNKYAIIKPYFYYNQFREKYYKNGTVEDIIDNIEDVDKKYINIARIITKATYDKFISKDWFSLPKISKYVMGGPEYIIYENELFSVVLEEHPVSEYYWRCKSIVALDGFSAKYDKLVSNNDLIDSKDGIYFFLNRDAIKFKKKEVEETVNNNTENIESAFDYDKQSKIQNNFYEFTKKNNLCYTLNDIYNFYTCIKSSQMIILAGMSGTGKTRLPLKYAEYFNMTEENGRLLFLPVSPSFTEPSDVLGFLNPTNGIYVASETGLVDFLIHASKYPEKMHMVIFDEMNLSQIEYWFAPFISILERDVNDRILQLYSENQRCINDEKYPSSIKIGKNIIFIGTINLDETTKNISDRLIDRAYIINLKKESFSSYYAQQSNLLNEIEYFDKDMDFYQFMPSEDSQRVKYIDRFNIRQLEFFDRIHNELNQIDSQKGVSFRSVKNISLYLQNKPNELDDRLGFDYAFKQTIMKKINGSADSIGDFLGYIDSDGSPQGALINIFDEFKDISEFKECRSEVKNRIIELKKYGYAR